MNKLKDISELKKVSKESALEYETYLTTMIDAVNQVMIELNKHENLIGDNDISMMKQNHLHHGQFMTGIFRLNDFQLLQNTLGWVVNSYEQHGFKRKYFKREIETWIEIIDKNIESDKNSEIIDVYQWIYEAIEEIDSIKNLNMEYPFTEEWKAVKGDFFNALISGKSKKTLEIARTIIKDKNLLLDFYLKVVTYAMYDLGSMWEKGMISVAQEHLATSTIMKVLSMLYLDIDDLDDLERNGKIVVAAPAGENHDIGARIIADALEVNGWDVIYLGANTPNKDLLELIKNEKPNSLILSITLTKNLDNLYKLIEIIKSDDTLKTMKVLVGGYALNYKGDFLDKLGADKISNSIEETIKSINGWEVRT